MNRQIAFLALLCCVGCVYSGDTSLGPCKVATDCTRIDGGELLGATCNDGRCSYTCSHVCDPAETCDGANCVLVGPKITSVNAPTTWALQSGTVSVTADQACVSVGSVGQCFCPGQNRPNACDTGVCGPNGTCDSPIDGLCSNQKFRSCTPGSGTANCDAIFPGSGTCTDTPRPCFGPTISRTGQCATPGNTGTLVSFFCIPATKAPAINTTAGLPGPGALSLPAISVRAVRQ